MSAPDGSAPASFGWMRATEAGLSFRPLTDRDLPFLYQVYASTRTEELAPLPWSDDQKAEFLNQQFRAQHADYERNYSGADRLVVSLSGEPVGRLYLDRGDREYSVIDIALLPEYRSRGLGGAVMRDLIDEAARANGQFQSMSKNSTRRCGFTGGSDSETTKDKGVYDLMRWTAEIQVNTAS